MNGKKESSILHFVKIMHYFNNLIIDEKVHLYCQHYVLVNDPNMTYADNSLAEYYPKSDVFHSNFSFEYFCIGRLLKKLVPTHVDEDRESALIIPFSNILVTTDKLYTCDIPFLIDTTKPHSAEATVDSLFVALDFKKSYQDALNHLLQFETLNLKIL